MWICMMVLSNTHTPQHTHTCLILRYPDQHLLLSMAANANNQHRTYVRASLEGSSNNTSGGRLSWLTKPQRWSELIYSHCMIKDSANSLNANYQLLLYCALAWPLILEARWQKWPDETPFIRSWGRAGAGQNVVFSDFQTWVVIWCWET